MIKKDKVKVIKKTSGDKDLYINGVKVENLLSYKIEDCMEGSVINIEIFAPDVEIVNEDKNENSKPIEINLQVNGVELAKAIVDSINNIQRQSAKTLLEI